MISACLRGQGKWLRPMDRIVSWPPGQRNLFTRSRPQSGMLTGEVWTGINAKCRLGVSISHFGPKRSCSWDRHRRRPDEPTWRPRRAPAAHELPRDILPPSLFPVGRALQRRGNRSARRAAVPSDRRRYRYVARPDAGCWFSNAAARRRRGDMAQGVVPEILEKDQNR